METAGAIKRIKGLSDAAAGVANKIKKLSGPVMRVLDFSPASDLIAPAAVLCAQINKGRLDIIYASRSFSKYRVKAHKNYRFDDDSLPSPAEVGSTMAVAMKDFGVRRADVQLIIPKFMVAMKAASLPAAAKESLADVVRFEFDRFTPFSADEALYDYLIEKETGSNLDLIIAAAKASAITDYSNTLLERGIPAKSVTFDMSCLATLCRFVTGYEFFMFAEIDRCCIKSGIVDNGMLKTASSQEFQCDDDVLMAIIIEDYIAEQKTSFGEDERKKPLVLLFREESPSLKELLKSRGNVSFETLDNIGQKIAGASGLDATKAVAVGGAIEHLWPKARKYNLLSKGVRERLGKPFLLTAMLVVALIVCIAAYQFSPIQSETERLAEINRQINIRKAEVQNVERIKGEIESINKRLALINNFKHDKPPYIDLFRELTQLIPKNTWLTRVRIAGSQANLEGYAPSATSLIQILEASKFFEKVEFSSPTFRDARMNMDRFQIKMELRGSKPAEAVNEKR